MERIFALPERFTKYVFDEELLLFYIRTTYISFVKLYNKNFSITKLVETLHESRNMNVDFGELYDKKLEEKERISMYKKESSLSLCKKHLKCLFSIAKNRNEDTRRKLFQFKIV